MKKFLKLCLPLLALGGVVLLTTPFIVSCSKNIVKSFLDVMNENRHKDLKPFIHPFNKEQLKYLKEGGVLNSVEYLKPMELNNNSYSKYYEKNYLVIDAFTDGDKYIVGSFVNNWLYVDTNYNIYITYKYWNNYNDNFGNTNKCYRLFYEVV